MSKVNIDWRPQVLNEERALRQRLRRQECTPHPLHTVMRFPLLLRQLQMACCRHNHIQESDLVTVPTDRRRLDSTTYIPIIDQYHIQCSVMLLRYANRTSISIELLYKLYALVSTKENYLPYSHECAYFVEVNNSNTTLFGLP